MIVKEGLSDLVSGDKNALLSSGDEVAYIECDGRLRSDHLHFHESVTLLDCEEDELPYL